MFFFYNILNIFIVLWYVFFLIFNIDRKSGSINFIMFFRYLKVKSIKNEKKKVTKGDS